LGRKSCGKKIVIRISLFKHLKKLHSEVSLVGDVYSAQAQAAYIIIVRASSFSPLLSRTRSLGGFGEDNRLSHHPEWSGRTIDGEVDGLDMFDLLRHTHKL